ncbi:MAG TPA: chemotaxis protein CheB, partial [Polyangiaceae bacterium]|nr:chemotaxis protein CheB [Polyangiaceae bacterium]
VLTGMGRDGERGARAIRDHGGVVLAESESSCVVYGMPRAVIEAGLAQAEVPLDRMRSEIERWL